MKILYTLGLGAAFCGLSVLFAHTVSLDSPYWGLALPAATTGVLTGTGFGLMLTSYIEDLNFKYG